MLSFQVEFYLRLLRKQEILKKKSQSYDKDQVKVVFERYFVKHFERLIL